MHSEKDIGGYTGKTQSRKMINLKKYRKDISSEYVNTDGSLGEGDLKLFTFLRHVDSNDT